MVESGMLMSKRLSRIYERIEPCFCLADIGCDHGLLSCRVVLEGKAERVIAVDISENSLKKTEQLAKAYGISDRVQCRCGDGFSVVGDSDCVDTTVIAGMGGLEILKILSDYSLTTIQKFLFCPHTKQEELRRGLVRLGFNIVFDSKLKDGNKFYDIIEAVKAEGVVSQSEREILFGKTNLTENNKDFLEFLKLEEQRLAKILEKRYNHNIESRLHMTRILLNSLV